MGITIKEDTTVSASWVVYVLQCRDSLYCGITNDLARRVAAHQAGRGAKYTRSHQPVHLLVAWTVPDKGTALRDEHAFKKLTKKQKLAFIGG